MNEQEEHYEEARRFWTAAEQDFNPPDEFKDGYYFAYLEMSNGTLTDRTPPERWRQWREVRDGEQAGAS
jgi:hypothetical protein